MREQDTTVVEIDQEVLGSATNPRYGATRNGEQVLGERVAQPFSANQHLRDGLVEDAL